MYVLLEDINSYLLLKYVFLVDQYNIKVYIYYINIYLYLHAYLCRVKFLESFVIFDVTDCGSRACAWQ